MAVHGAMRLVLASVLMLAFAAQAEDFAEAREDLVREVVRYARLVGDGSDRGLDPAVVESLATVERHRFVPERELPFAYENRPLPIGHGQTISQPYIVALMTDLIDPRPGDRVLEIGTGSGYQAAILAEIVSRVFTIEIIEPLHETARERLTRLGYDNVATRLGDGYFGWPEEAPFDAIVVTAAPSHVPPPLVQQLARGGRMVIPVGGRWATQQLLLIERRGNDEIITRQVAPVRFVPLTGQH